MWEVPQRPGQRARRWPIFKLRMPKARYAPRADARNALQRRISHVDDDEESMLESKVERLEELWRPRDPRLQEVAAGLRGVLLVDGQAAGRYVL